MKSPLVEALRHASGESSATESTNNTTGDNQNDDPNAAAHSEESAQAGELQLMESTVVATVDAAADDLDVADLDVASTGVSSSIVEGENMQLALASPSALVSPPHCRGWGLAKLGSYSPMIGIVLAITTSSCYFLYQSLGGNYHNADLAALSSQIGSGGQSTIPPVPARRSLNRFELIVSPARQSQGNTIKQRQPDSAERAVP